MPAPSRIMCPKCGTRRMLIMPAREYVCSGCCTSVHMRFPEPDPVTRADEGWTTVLADLLYEPPEPYAVGRLITPDMEYKTPDEWAWVIRAVHQPDGTIVHERVKFVAGL